MKTFEIRTEYNRFYLVDGIGITKDPYPHVGVGEEGRGRKYVRFPIGRNLRELSRLETAGLIKTKNNTLLLVEERCPDDRALVLVNVPAGFRGSTSWTAAEYVMVACPERGRWLFAHHGELTPDGKHCASCGCLLGENDKHPMEGMSRKYQEFPPQGVEILAEGRCATGQAGRAGGHAVRLLIMQIGTSFRVVRHGRLYGAPAEWFIRWDGSLLRFEAGIDTL